MKGPLTSRQMVSTSDQRYLGVDDMVIVKQFKFVQDQSCFRKELKLLKRIKRLGLENNGGFPVVLSAKTSNTYGEIMMSFVGPTIENKFGLNLSLEQSSICVPVGADQVFKMGFELVSQLEILHRLGYCHGDIKLQNICFNSMFDMYTLIDFGLSRRIFRSNGTLRSQH